MSEQFAGFTTEQLTHALGRFKSEGNINMAHGIATEIDRRNGKAPATDAKMPNMDAYLARCVARCRPKGGN